MNGRSDRPARTTHRVVPLAAAAAGLVLMHVLIDQHLGLFGATSDDMSVLQAANVVGHGLLFAWWIALTAWARPPARAGAPLALTILVATESLLFNGLIGVAACPPPCSGAFPYQDVVHFANILVGGWAAWTVYTYWRAAPESGGRALPWTTVAVLLVAMALSAPLSIQVLSRP